jgi:hypothetical protein
MQPLGSLEEQLHCWIKPTGACLNGFLEQMAGASLPLIDDTRLTDFVPCRAGQASAEDVYCRHVYCSDECEAADQGHRLLCISNPELLPKHRYPLARVPTSPSLGCVQDD